MADTDLLQRIAELEAQLQAQQVAAQHEMQQFTYTVSHDLRAPLRHIVAYAQLVQEDAGHQLSTDVQGFLATITDSAKHMSVMLDALMEFSRVGTTPVQMGVVELHDVLQDVVATVVDGLHQRRPQREVHWTVTTDAPAVQADAALLRLALEQVLCNACKFAHPGARSEVVVSTALGDGVVHLTVQDKGVGFNPAQADKLFQPFARLHTSRQFEGLGMGLAKTRKALARMGGAVAISASPDAGCSVTLSLPVAQG
jgi:light-regulated signal transduction histidine kinase (bacteriophytochrome)